MVQTLRIHVMDSIVYRTFTDEQGSGHTKLSHKSLSFETLEYFYSLICKQNLFVTNYF